MKELNRLAVMAGVDSQNETIDIEESRGISDDTWNRMKSYEKKKYIKAHPMSKFAQDKKYGMKNENPSFKDKLNIVMHSLPEDTQRTVRNYAKMLEKKREALKANDYDTMDKLSDRIDRYFGDRLSYDAVYDKGVKKVIDFLEKEYKDVY